MLRDGLMQKDDLDMRTNALGTTPRILATATLGALGMLVISAAQGQTPKYSVTNLGALLSSAETDGVSAVSADGTKVAGQADVAGTLHSFYWDGTMHDAGITGGLFPFAVASNGVVLIGAYPATVWTLAAGNVTLYGPNGPASCLGMNDSAEVVGHGVTSTIVGHNPDGSPIYARIGLHWARNPATGNWDYTLLPPLAGYDTSIADRIDLSGNIIGTSYITNPNSGDPSAQVAVRWSAGDGHIPHYVGPLNAPNGFIKAFSVDALTLNTLYVWNDQSTWKGFYTDWNGTTELPQPVSANPLNVPYGVNASGLVAGIANYSAGTHAYAWANGVQTDLGVLAGMASSVLSQGVYVKPVNADGFIVGWSTGFPGKSGNVTHTAFISTPASRATSTRMLDLNSLLSNTLKSVGLTSLTQGISVNDGGFIICDGITTGAGYRRAVLLKRVQ